MKGSSPHPALRFSPQKPGSSAEPDLDRRLRGDDRDGRPAPAPVARAKIIAAARSWLGTPYVHQASAKAAGCDCLGLVRGVWRALYGAEPELPPPYTPDWNERAFARGRRAEPLIEAARRHLGEAPLAARRPGDVLVFRIVPYGPAKHCGIMSGETRFIHAYAGRAVVESWLNRWWLDRLAGVFVFPGAEGRRESGIVNRASEE